MGSSKYVMVGPYLRVVPKRVDRVNDSGKRCPQYGCRASLQSTARYCPEHGMILERAERVESVEQVSDLLGKDEWVDQLYQPENLRGHAHMILLSNSGPKDRSFYAKDDHATRVFQHQIEQDMDWFRTQHQHLVEEIRKLSDVCEVCWGVVTYWS